MLMAYLEVLEAHGWVRMPMTLNTSITFFAHGAHLLDRVQVSKGCWSHYQFDGTSWLTDAKARGDDAAGLDAYLTTHFRSGKR
jgi:hypothetical protein